MQKTFLKALCFLPLVALLIGVNLYADPANLFRPSYEKQIANILLSGNNACGTRNYDERLALMYYLQGRNEPIETAVITGSHFAQLRPAEQDSSFYNCFLSALSVYDMVGIAGLYYEMGYFPKTIFIEIQSTSFDGEYLKGDLRYKSLSEYIEKMRRVLDGNPESQDVDNWNTKIKTAISNPKYLELISFSYFQESIKILPDKNEILVTSTQDNYGENAIKRMNGSIAYSKSTREILPQDVDALIEKMVNNNVLTHTTPNYHMDADIVAEFEKLIEFLHNNGSNVIFLLSPYPPDIYNIVLESQPYSEVPEVESYALDLAEKHNIPIFGSLNPYNVHCTNDDFFDYGHIREESLYKVLTYSGLNSKEEIIIGILPLAYNLRTLSSNGS